jgi:hypothetical protein
MHMLWVASRSCALVALFGWQRVLLIHLPIMVVAARWTAKGDWSFADAALRVHPGSACPPSCTG